VVPIDWIHPWFNAAMSRSRFWWFDDRRDYAALFIRLAVGTRLVEGAADHVFSYARMLEFEQFLAAHGAPRPRSSLSMRSSCVASSSSSACGRARQRS